MKVQIILPLSIAVSVVAFGLLKVRVKDLTTEENKLKFQNVKLRVTDDVLTEYAKEKKNLESGMEREKAAQAELGEALTELTNDALKSELGTCTGAKKTAADEIASMQEEVKKFEDESAKEKANWEAEIAALNEKLNKPSPICNYLKPGSTVQGLCPEKKEEPKAEPQQPAEEKKEPPKPEEKKPEPPKPEEAKPDAPKPDAPKPEEPKQEAPKQ